MRISSCFVVALSLLSVAAGAQGAMYKCRHSDGSVTYSDRPCPADQTPSQIAGRYSESSGQSPGDEVCNRVRDFARKVGTAMRAGVRSSEIFDVLGGLNSIKAPMLQVIDYVYSFSHYQDASPEGIGGLAYQKCMGGGFDIPVPKVGSGPARVAHRDSSGSGFLVNSAGYILTNHHVIDGCTEILVPFRRRRLTARLVGSDPSVDLAIIQANGIAGTPAAFRTAGSLRLGEEVVVAGFPLRQILADQLNVSTGTISSLAGISDNYNQIQVTAPVQPGNSGGPLLDQSGRVVGIVVSKLNALAMAQRAGAMSENVNFAVKADAAVRLLDQYSVDYTVSSENVDKAPTEIAEEARSYTVPIECRG